jgi:hypothetical protein
MRYRKLFPLALLLAVILIVAGCGANSAVTHPGQLNAFDGTAYDTLIAVQASIQQAKALEPQFPQYKSALDDAIAAYNSAIAAYKLYHTQAAGAPATAALQIQITTLVNSVAALLTQMGVKL